MAVHRVLKLELLCRALVGWAVVATIARNEDTFAAGCFTEAGGLASYYKGDGEFGVDA